MRYPCDVELIATHHRCGTTPARAFTAYCYCGDKITGYICETCSLCDLPGCLTCWRDGKGHDCPVEFTAAECLCGCRQPVAIAARNQARDHIIRGRPVRYAQGHGRWTGRGQKRAASGHYEPAPCGTPAAARRHYRRGEPLDEACRRAQRDQRAGYMGQEAGALSPDLREIRNGIPVRPYVYRGGAS